MDIAHSPKVGTSDMNILLSEFAMLYKLNNLKKKNNLKDKIHTELDHTVSVVEHYLPQIRIFDGELDIFVCHLRHVHNWIVGIRHVPHR